ncbi:bifunctional phosphoribosylaminoimidazolecarboxamide formyltransferase/IMP cyclohydrolase [Candidatus Woesearchaeota archaeon]|nr:bifunctional phosphoribosylaminoimidazolecarboxamide formyltransferase/IMP cyclohydrolase [Candidatus Woesearchaeota archaeon]
MIKMDHYAIVSVYDKRGLDTLVDGLVETGFGIISTGGTYDAIRKIICRKKLKARLYKVSEITGSPEILDGRVKTLHPMIHGSILYRRDKEEHMKEAGQQKLLNIEVVAINLYPFEAAVEKGAGNEELIEEIDIGGPTMLISAVKNHEHVSVVVDPEMYPKLISELKKNNCTVPIDTRRRFAVRAINRLADYRSTIAQELSARLAGEESLRLSYKKGKKIGKYGENWHQKAWIYNKGKGLADSEQLSGIELGYNNYFDMDAAFSALLDIKDNPAAVIVKHHNPCGIATGKNLLQSLKKAWEGDDISAFGSVICLSEKPGMDTLRFLDGRFIEVLIVPDIDKECLSYLKEKKKNLRVIRAKLERTEDYEYRSIEGGMLKTTKDRKLYLGRDKELFGTPALVRDNLGKERLVGQVTKKKMDEGAIGLVEFSIKASRCLKSNAITICYEYEKGHYQQIGMGCGQPNRLNSVKIAAEKALHNMKEQYGMEKASEILSSDRVVLCSDAFFPFSDSIEIISELGIRNVIQPGGSIKDREVIGSADSFGMSMIFTGVRHFKH